MFVVSNARAGEEVASCCMFQGASLIIRSSWLIVNVLHTVWYRYWNKGPLSHNNRCTPIKPQLLHIFFKLNSLNKWYKTDVRGGGDSVTSLSLCEVRMRSNKHISQSGEIVLGSKPARNGQVNTISDWNHRILITRSLSTQFVSP
jgi:hypothetical protein